MPFHLLVLAFICPHIAGAIFALRSGEEINNCLGVTSVSAKKECDTWRQGQQDCAGQQFRLVQAVLKVQPDDAVL